MTIDKKINILGVEIRPKDITNKLVRKVLSCAGHRERYHFNGSSNDSDACANGTCGGYDIYQGGGQSCDQAYYDPSDWYHVHNYSRAKPGERPC